MRRCVSLTLFIALLVSLPSARAGEAKSLAPDAAIEARVHRLGEELRCLVCQNQSLADSHSGLAEDLRREMRTQMAGGKSDQEVVDFMVARYGDFVRYRPPFKASTFLLWLGPLLLLLLAVIALFRFFRKSDQEPS